MAAHAADRPTYSVPPPVPPIAALVLITILDLTLPVPFLPRGVPEGVGIPLVVAGVGLWGWGMASLSREGESPSPFTPTERLLTEGALRTSRNPMYTGRGIGLLGLALLLDTATGVAVVAALALTAHSLVREEERYLEAKFGDDYREYRSRVRRWM
jgi:protein-S-isoprenylcysteine O-methyltransferase Ste14